MRNIVFLIATCSLVGACAGGNYIDRRSLPVVAYDKTSAFASSRHTGDDDLIVVTRTADNTLVPAECTLDGNGYRAGFVGSSRVTVPVYGRSQNRVTVTCAYQGNTITQQADVENLTQVAIQSNTRIVSAGCSNASAGGGNVGVASSIAASGFCNDRLGRANADLQRLQQIPDAEQQYGFTATPDFVF